MSESFVHLRVHSAYSLSEGAIKVAKIAELARKAKMPAVAITDTNNLFGALEFSQTCAKAGIQPIIGCQLSLARPDKPDLPPDPIVALAQDAAGLRNLQILSSRGFLDAEPPRPPQIPLSLLLDHAEGLILLTGGTRGPLARLLGEGQEAEADRLAAMLREAFGDRLAVELHRHRLPDEDLINAAQVALADRLSLPLVATNDCHFAEPGMFEAQDALLCIAEGRILAETNRRRLSPEHWFKGVAEMRALFADLPEACDNTLAIARRCRVMVETRKPILPRFPDLAPGEREEELLARMAREGLAARLAATGADEAEARRYHERLEYELGVITAMGFAGYFLIVADFIQWAKAQGIPVGPGRGSGAGSLVAWALTITDLDPLRFGLLFERFLNPERVSMPDFDIDFCQDRRDEVIAYVRRKYGADRVAQIITFGKLQARAAVRDVGRVLGLPYGQVNRIAELIPNNPAKPTPLAEAIASEPRLAEEKEKDEAVARLLEIALKIEGLYRHASTHAAGVVIGDRPLIELIPLYRDPRSDFLVTQYSMKYVEQAGLVKFDFLGLTTLTILERAVHFLARQGVTVDLARIPLDDPKTYAMLGRGETGGVFQFESQGMRDVLRQMRPDRFEDLIAAVALYRPGPMANIPAYCQRKHGEPWQAPHPELADILGETYGIMVYQEQVMQIAQRLAGYSLGAADLLRRAMGKKIRSEMEAQRRIFLEGARARGIDPDQASEIFDLMERFADYGFNKSHAAAYALVAYQTAWLRANYPHAFFAASMSAAINNTDKLAALIQEAKGLGITVLPPDINRSEADFALERLPDGEFAIRYALAAIKKVGRAAMEAVVAARGERPFADLADFAERIDPRALNRMQLENLAKAGAFDSIEPNRAKVHAAGETLLKRAQAAQAERASGMVGLFAGIDPKARRLSLPETTPWLPVEALGFESEAIGFHLTAHPLDPYRRMLERLGVVPSHRLRERLEAGVGRVKLAGSVIAVKERTTRTGSRMAWVRLSDSGGSFEITLFSEVLGQVRDMLEQGANLLATVDVRAEGETLRLTAVEVRSLDAVVTQTGQGMRIWVSEAAALAGLDDVLRAEKGGRGRVRIVSLLRELGEEVEIELPGTYAITPALAHRLARMPGVSRLDDL
jgi:DNA polymerase-3 subunit alpha